MRNTGRGDGVDRFLMGVAQVAGLVTLAALGYLLYALFSPAGYLSTPERFSPAQQAAIARNVHWACQALAVGIVFLLGSLVFRSRAFPELGYLQALAGAGLLLGGPWLVETALGGARPGWAASEIVRTFRALGLLCLAAGATYALLDVVDRLRARRPRRRTEDAFLTSPRRVREALASEKPANRFLGKCWNLPYCRPAVKPFCPVFRRHQGPCWRKGVGCMCSEEVLLIAARNEGYDVERGLGGRSGGLMVIPTIDQLERQLTPKQKRERCGRCVIYLHHQEQKYRLATWATVAAVIAAVLYWRPVWHHLYVQAATATERITRVVALPNPARPEEMHPALESWAGRLAESTAVEWFAIFCLALLALTYLLRAVEFAIYRMRW